MNACNLSVERTELPSTKSLIHISILSVESLLPSNFSVVVKTLPQVRHLYFCAPALFLPFFLAKLLQVVQFIKLYY